MVIDTSAVMAIVFGETDAPLFREAILNAPRIVMSAASAVEASWVALQAGGDASVERLDRIFEVLGVEFRPVDKDQIQMARLALNRFGRGRHSAKLNFGDSFAYALAVSLDEPLLFKGGDFDQTDVGRVLWA